MIRKMHTDEFDRIFSIMENSFPSDEYRTYEEQKKLLLNKKYDIYTFIIKERIQGFISIWKFDDFLYIEHLAVDADCRNHGAGAKLLDEMKNLFPGRICLEVELPVTEMAKRRIGFYKRNGFSVNDYPYMQPAYSKEKNPIELRIVSSQGLLSGEEFTDVRDALYREVYHKYE